MAEEKLEYTVKAKDESATVLRRVLGDIGEFAHKAVDKASEPFRKLGETIRHPFEALTSLKGFALMENIEIIKSLGERIGDLIDQSARLDVVKTTFESLTGSTGPAAERMARQLNNAANGMLSTARAMELANKAIPAGLSLDQIGTVMDFASKKAVSTGAAASETMDRIFRSLSRGAGSFLEELGVLDGGMDEVQKSFDAIHGSNAFEQLSPAARNSRFIEASMMGIKQQMSAMGLTGRETVFQFGTLKGSFGEVLDKLIGAVGKSQIFRSIIADAANVANRLAVALGGPDQEKAFSILAEGAKSLLRGVFVDAGRLLAVGITDAASEFGPAIIKGIKSVGEVLLNTLTWSANQFLARLEEGLGKVMILGTKPFEGVFDNKWIKETLNSKPPGTGVATDILNFRQHGVGEETSKALRQISGNMTGQYVGEDAMERQESAAKRILTPSERFKLEREKAGLERSSARLEGLGGRLTDDEMYKARRELGKQRLAYPELRRLSPSESEARVRTIATENRQAEVERQKKRIGEIGEQLEASPLPWPVRRQRAAAQLGIGAGFLGMGGLGGLGPNLALMSKGSESFATYPSWLERIGGGVSSLWSKGTSAASSALGRLSMPALATTLAAPQVSYGPGHVNWPKARDSVSKVLPNLAENWLQDKISEPLFRVGGGEFLNDDMQKRLDQVPVLGSVRRWAGRNLTGFGAKDLAGGIRDVMYQAFAPFSPNAMVAGMMGPGSAAPDPMRAIDANQGVIQALTAGALRQHMDTTAPSASKLQAAADRFSQAVDRFVQGSRGPFVPGSGGGGVAQQQRDNLNNLRAAIDAIN